MHSQLPFTILGASRKVFLGAYSSAVFTCMLGGTPAASPMVKLRVSIANSFVFAVSFTYPRRACYAVQYSASREWRRSRWQANLISGSFGEKLENGNEIQMLSFFF